MGNVCACSKNSKKKLNLDTKSKNQEQGKIIVLRKKASDLKILNWWKS